MPRRTPFLRLLSPVVLGLLTPMVLALVPGAAAGQSPLPLGSTVAGSLGPDGRASYTLSVGGAGFLTVVARSAQDIRLLVTDAEGQPLPDGRVDTDHGGDVGAEQAVVILPRGGAYAVHVESFGGGAAAFTVGGSFLASELVALAPDPDGVPSAARPLAAGADQEDSIDPGAGDPWDWYRIDAGQGGILTVLTRAEEGDLRLELYREGAWSEPAETSDQDEGGVLGNESITVDVAAGQSVWVRVAPAFMGGGMVRYRVASGLIPG